MTVIPTNYNYIIGTTTTAVAAAATVEWLKENWV